MPYFNVENIDGLNKVLKNVKNHLELEPIKSGYDFYGRLFEMQEDACSSHNETIKFIGLIWDGVKNDYVDREYLNAVRDSIQKEIYATINSLAICDMMLDKIVLEDAKRAQELKENSTNPISEDK